MATTELVTVTLPAELVESIDRLEENRSRFILEAVEHELVRRRREGLLRSLANPHPEAAELTETGLAEWGASRIRRGFGRVAKDELAAIDQGFELFLGLGAEP